MYLTLKLTSNYKLNIVNCNIIKDESQTDRDITYNNNCNKIKEITITVPIIITVVAAIIAAIITIKIFIMTITFTLLTIRLIILRPTMGGGII